MAKGKKFGRKDKKIVVFDEESRREYLLGFRKRKNERRKKAQEELQTKSREKMIEVRAENKRKMLDEMRKQTEQLEALQSDAGDDEDGASSLAVDTTYDHPEHVVTVTSITDVDLDGGLTTIGPNKGLESIQAKVPSIKPKTSEDQKKTDSNQYRNNKSKFKPRGKVNKNKSKFTKKPNSSQNNDSRNPKKRKKLK
ncbi:predicted protein [Nematostella vectensis]|uniref:Nucleolar protein 12 n=1 Tax=Nematostella vectensis TaxID=45351 RepID=A7SDX3_NEMVE|nr:nucleolar protein 12 [Nematostella vectensis]EDO38089.1 predicted protein [Nematostella vectensis]|eukprot:XP_001630152.1 predicted protein [Nematostella vectensis]